MSKTKSKTSLDRIEVFLFDMDGVIYREESPLPLADRVISRIRQRGGKVRFLTNNSTKTREFFVRRLKRMGIEASREEILSSAWATARYMERRGWNSGRALVIGEKGLAVEIRRIGLETVKEPPAEYVVVGLDRSFSYKKLSAGLQAINDGARFIATNDDATFPLADGVIIPGGGTMVAALQKAAGFKPLIIGKPNRPFIAMIRRMEKCDPTHILMVGDRMDTDILFGRKAGFVTALVLTGVTSPENAAALEPKQRPDMIWNNLGDMLKLL